MPEKRAIVAVARKLAVLLHRLWCAEKCTNRYATVGRCRRPTSSFKWFDGVGFFQPIAEFG